MKVYRAEEQSTSDEILLECDFMWAGQQARSFGARPDLFFSKDEPCSSTSTCARRLAGAEATCRGQHRGTCCGAMQGVLVHAGQPAVHADACRAC